MSDENSHERNNLRIAVGSTLVVVGAALVGPALNSMLQVEPCPWWAIILLIAGVISLIIGLLILIVPPKKWRSLSPIRIQKQIRSNCIWLFRGPKWSCSKPIIFLNEVFQTPDDDIRGQIKYGATISLTIKNRDKSPLEVGFYSLTVNIEQRYGRSKIKKSLYPNISNRVTIQPSHKDTFKFHLHGICDERRMIDVKKPYDWGIQGILVALNGVFYRELHSGIYYKPVPQTCI